MMTKVFFMVFISEHNVCENVHDFSDTPVSFHDVNIQDIKIKSENMRN